MNKELPDGIISMMDKSYNQGIDHAIEILKQHRPKKYSGSAFQEGNRRVLNDIITEVKKLKKNTSQTENKQS